MVWLRQPWDAASGWEHCWLLTEIVFTFQRFGIGWRKFISDDLQTLRSILTLSLCWSLNEKSGMVSHSWIVDRKQEGNWARLSAPGVTLLTLKIPQETLIDLIPMVSFGLGAPIQSELMLASWSIPQGITILDLACASRVVTISPISWWYAERFGKSRVMQQL
jgi:hypothetical protein